MKATSFPKRNFQDGNAEETARMVEEDIRSLAHKWKYKNTAKKRRPAAIRNAATEAAALYLQANHALYIREDRQAMKDAYQGWMLMIQKWFYEEIEKRRGTGGAA